MSLPETRQLSGPDTADLASYMSILFSFSETRGLRRTRSFCRGVAWCGSDVSLWRSRFSPGSCYDGDWWRGPCGSACSRTLPWNARCALGRWRIARTCSLLAPGPKRCCRRRMSTGLWRLRRRHSGGLLVAELSVVKLSGRLFLPHLVHLDP